jgi:hypothetical protein
MAHGRRAKISVVTAVVFDVPTARLEAAAGDQTSSEDDDEEKAMLAPGLFVAEQIHLSSLSP